MARYGAHSLAETDLLSMAGLVKNTSIKRKLEPYESSKLLYKSQSRGGKKNS